MYVKSVLAALFLTVSLPLFSQVAPQATEGGLPLVVGAGFSNFDVDWGHTRMEGGTLWIDYYLNHLPPMFHGLGLEVEARDISLNPGDKPSNFRQDTAGGGVIYAWPHYRNFHPYGKAIVSYGSFDFADIPGVPNYKHDSRNVYASGGGFDFRIFGHIWGRADYEYQFWPSLFGGVPDPQGFTVGAMYDFRQHRAH